MQRKAGGIEEDVAIQLTTIIAGPTHNKNVLKNNIIFFFCLQSKKKARKKKQVKRKGGVVVSGIRGR